MHGCQTRSDAMRLSCDWMLYDKDRTRSDAMRLSCDWMLYDKDRVTDLASQTWAISTARVVTMQKCTVVRQEATRCDLPDLASQTRAISTARVVTMQKCMVVRQEATRCDLPDLASQTKATPARSPLTFAAAISDPVYRLGVPCQTVRYHAASMYQAHCH
ncbi:hypothetical protein J6590_025987 [Homalodisca vitripennis]|nr:hypothetical protein J6590_025987 [Homalodisca vitripennis]